MQVSIRSVVLKDRVRQDLGDLTSLMESMRKYGQINPVVITESGELIAGHRRLEAARRLGWSSVEAVRTGKIDEIQKLEMELDENLHRKDLTPTEVLDGFKRLEQLRRPSLWKRLVSFFGKIVRYITKVMLGDDDGDVRSPAQDKQAGPEAGRAAPAPVPRQAGIEGDGSSYGV